MPSPLETFFAAWQETDPAAQKAMIAEAVDAGCTYSDPRSGGDLTGLDAIAAYVAMFAANAPGWGASVEKADDVNGYLRATVAFGGKGPDGTDMVQHGTYFATTGTGGKLTLLAGFVGA